MLIALLLRFHQPQERVRHQVPGSRFFLGFPSPRKSDVTCDSCILFVTVDFLMNQSVIMRGHYILHICRLQS
ncbi:hypothetical protein Hanom_Chr14g01294601 [Helianthus anomalus]